MSHTSESEDSQHDRCQSMTSLIQINRILSLHGFRMVHWYLFFFQSYYWQTKACYLQCEFYLSALFSFTLSLWSDFSNSTCLTPSAKFILSFFLFLRRNTICIFLRPLFFFFQDVAERFRDLFRLSYLDSKKYHFTPSAEIKPLRHKMLFKVKETDNLTEKKRE